MTAKERADILATFAVVDVRELAAQSRREESARQPHRKDFLCCSVCRREPVNHLGNGVWETVCPACQAEQSEWADVCPDGFAVAAESR